MSRRLTAIIEREGNACVSFCPEADIASQRAAMDGARVQADKLVGPKTHHVRLESATLRTKQDARAWAEKTERGLLEQVKQGPIVIN